MPKANLPTVFNSQWYANGGIVIITWDSATTADKTGWNTGSGGHIPTSWCRPPRKAHSSTGGTTMECCGRSRKPTEWGNLGASSMAANGDLTPAL
jgi:hypothetical protein